MALGRLQPNDQYYQASGESTTQGKLPEQFKSTPVATSPIADQLNFSADWVDSVATQPRVTRVPRKHGMRYLYARGARRQPYERLGHDALPRPNISAYQPNDMGPIRDAGFNDALFQAGYPGFNLGLSFKVPTLPSMGGPRTNMDQGGPQTVSQTRRVKKLFRAIGKPDRR